MIYALWVGGRLSPIEQVCLASFVAMKYRVCLYHYDPVEGAPPGVELRLADEILPRRRVFVYKQGEGAGSPAAFANLFRYRMLQVHGGWWVDTDVICLRPFPQLAPLSYCLETDDRISNAVMKAPEGHELVRSLYDEADMAGSDVTWGHTGPLLLTRVAQRLGLDREALPKGAYCPIAYEDWRLPFLATSRARVNALTSTSFALHLWNEMLRRNGYSKYGPFEEGCFFVDVARRLGVDVPVAAPDSGKPLHKPVDAVLGQTGAIVPRTTLTPPAAARP